MYVKLQIYACCYNQRYRSTCIEKNIAPNYSSSKKDYFGNFWNRVLVDNRIHEAALFRSVSRRFCDTSTVFAVATVNFTQQPCNSVHCDICHLTECHQARRGLQHTAGNWAHSMGP